MAVLHNSIVEVKSKVCILQSGHDISNTDICKVAADRSGRLECMHASVCMHMRQFWKATEYVWTYCVPYSREHLLIWKAWSLNQAGICLMHVLNAYMYTHLSSWCRVIFRFESLFHFCLHSASMLSHRAFSWSLLRHLVKKKLVCFLPYQPAACKAGW